MRQKGEEWHTTQLLHAFFQHCPNFNKQHKAHTHTHKFTHLSNAFSQYVILIKTMEKQRFLATWLREEEEGEQHGKNQHTICSKYAIRIRLSRSPLPAQHFAQYASISWKVSQLPARRCYHQRWARAMSQFHLIHPINFVNNKCKRRKTNTWPGMLLLLLWVAFVWCAFESAAIIIIIIISPSFFCSCFHVHCADIFDHNKYIYIYWYLWKSHGDQGHQMFYSISLLLL